MKIFYLNDSINNQIIYVDTMHGPGKPLRPQEAGVFEVDIPEGYIPFVKTWGTIVLISRCQEEAAKNFYGGKNE